MAVPFLELHAQFSTVRDDVLTAINRVVESQHFILGPEVEALERDIAQLTQSQFAIGVSSGTDALLVALMGLDIAPGDEVITTPFSFFATAGCIARLGAKPVFVDIDPQTFNLDPAGLEANITPRTQAIIPVHLYGQTADMDPIVTIAKRHELAVLEDAAQAIGAMYHGRPAGSLGNVAALSFFPTKNLGAFGDGGMVLTSDEALAKRMVMLRNHGFQPKYHSQVLGGNFRLDALQAAVLRAKLPHLQTWTEARRDHAAFYRQAFSETGLRSSDPTGPTEPGQIVLPIESRDCRHVYHQFVIRVAAERRDPLRKHLAEQQIGTEVYYPLPLHVQGCFANLGHRIGDFPHSERAAAETVALPIYAELLPEQQQRVVSAIAEYIRR
ncbi:MAG: DegT/DnrJ/EryC1/StrS family aminotransferase [Planctomycetes bacterium]|nr:DegT/DnrJ/EryC1/StrS family aminotransferase [Planctomycetota bacterium]